MKKGIATAGILIGCVCFLLAAPSAQATVFLMDGKLQVNGYFKEQAYLRLDIPKTEDHFHKSNFDFVRTSLFFESLYKMHESEDYTINLFTGFRYYWMHDPHIDSQLKRGIPSCSYKEYTHPRGEDFITEAYVHFIKGPFELRAGKQIVVWGETDIKRTADVINPLDVRYGSPGTEDWETLKLGLWMLRGFYQTDLPGNLMFEMLVIPGDFKYTRVPIEGTHYGPSPANTSFNPGKGFGIYEWVQEKARRDAPGWGLRNTEVGFKIRGYTWDIDWSIFYFNTRNDSPTANGNFSKFANTYVFSGLKSILTGSKIDPKFPGYKVFNYKRYEVIGGTAQTIIEKLHGSEWRFEWFYEMGNHFNKGTNNDSSEIYAECERDTVGGGLVYSDRFTIPWFTHSLANDKKLSLSLSMFYEKVLGDFHDIIIYESGRGHRPGDSHATEFVWSISQQLFQSQVMLMFTGSYNPIGKYFLCPILSYAPGSHWRWEMALPIYGSKASGNKGLHDKDSILFRIRYEF
ncbi:MAG: hypothetical protein JW832_08355 [Deltaproteobacteria bacterium]|nr:hypothetical protein [Deltaproteobacteria bacterium]